MKKLAAVVLIAAAVLGLSQCELFNTTVEYAVDGSGWVTVLYNDENGDGVQATVFVPWYETFELFSSDRPFAAALRVTNESGGPVDAFIREEGVDVDWITGLAPAATWNLWSWIE